MFKNDTKDHFHINEDSKNQDPNSLLYGKVKGDQMQINCFLSFLNSIPKWEKGNSQEILEIIAPSSHKKKMKKKTWDLQEEYILFKLHKELGNKWSEIAHQLPDRNDNSVKNFFYCKMRKIVRMLNKGIINDEIRRDKYSVWQALYLLDHVKSNYINEKNKEYKGDKYIIDMVEHGNITQKTFENYILFLFNSIDPDLRKKISSPDLKTSNSDIPNDFFEESYNINSSENKELKKGVSLPLPSNMYNPKFKLLSLENCDYSFLLDPQVYFKNHDKK